MDTAETRAGGVWSGAVFLGTGGISSEWGLRMGEGMRRCRRAAWDEGGGDTFVHDVVWE